MFGILLSFIVTIFWCGCTLGSPIVGGNPADPPNMLPIEDTATEVVFKPQKPVEPTFAAVLSALTNITVTGLQLPGLLAFLGIKYAKPPVGNRRFQRPTRLKLKKDIKATKFGPPCPQMKNNEVVGDEDCLTLNIYTPDEGLEDGGLPVLFWIHGGHYQSGSAAQYNPERLVKKGLIVVTPQYRLGSLGFLSIGREEMPGNAGIFDIGAALMWTKENIKHFGGNPKKIVPAGQGSGASLATFLAINPITSPIIQGLICLSGTALSPFSVDKNETETANQVSIADNCKIGKGVHFVRCMQNIPLENIIKGDVLFKSKKDPVKSVASLNSPGPAEEGINDNRFLPSFHSIPVLDAVKQGLFPDKIPLLTGVMNKETSAAVKGNLLDDFRSKLTSPSFLNKNILKDLLKANTGLYNNKSVNPGLKDLFNSDTYLKFFGDLTQSLTSNIDKVVQLTTDALFNLPAFVISHLWSKKGKVYLFSLEDAPKKSFASKFLPDIALTNPYQERNGAQHGDDLGLMFKPQDIYGQPIEDDELSADDISVSEYYINMVYEFARSGVPMLKSGMPWQPFSPENNNYMSITRKQPKEKNNFHKCEMGLWTGNSNILKSVECTQIGEAATMVVDILGSTGTGLLTSVKGTTDQLTKPLGTATNSLQKGLQNATKPLENRLGDMTDSLNTGLSKPLANLLQPGHKPNKTTPRPGNNNLLGGIGGILG